MLRVATFNINGIRATTRRGFATWLALRDPDVLALQEMRCPLRHLPDDAFGGYHLTYDSGTLPGRNGVAVLTRDAPAAVRTWGAPVLCRAPGARHVDVTATPPVVVPRALRPFVTEGRYLEVDLAGSPLTVASLYLPKGGLPAELQTSRTREVPDGGAKYLRKMRFLDGFARYLSAARRAAAARGREFLLLGDFNIAHTRADVRNWRTNQRSEGFLPQERAWFDSILTARTLHDVVRRVHGDVDGPYSWWSWRGAAFTADVGWRIDYHLATPALARAAIRAEVDREPTAELRRSDHAPVVVDYAL